MTGTTSASPFLLTYMSGADGLDQVRVGSSVTTSSVADDNWHHYAFVMGNGDALEHKSVLFQGTDASNSIAIDSNTELFSMSGSGTSDKAFTVACWVKSTGDGNSGHIVNFGDASISTQWEIAKEWQGLSGQEQIVLKLNDALNTKSVTVATATKLEEADGWTHLVITYDGRAGSAAHEGVKIYFNGTEQSYHVATTQAGYDGMVYNSASKLAWGARVKSGDPHVREFPGYLTECAVYGEELSAADVSALYNGGKFIDQKRFYAATPLGYWKMGSNITGISPNYTIVDEMGLNNLLMESFSGGATDGVQDHSPFTAATETTSVKLYVDGVCEDSFAGGTGIGYVSGTLNAAIGALAIAPSGTTTPGLGWGKLHASIDEFRFWKKARTSKKVQRYWFDQVGGGTNTDLANTDLGVYFKFNEGITQTASVDSTVLDYSGRISNGTWVGYDSTYSRNVGSAILESSASLIEFKDPIIYSFHPDVETYTAAMKASGSEHDDLNANSLMSHIPAWMWEENETESDQKNKNHLWNLLQIIGSYFDEASILINDLPKLKHAKYYSSGSNIPPFVKKGVEDSGLVVPELFLGASLLEQFEDRNDELKFETSLRDVKNIIYQNIYNNLTYIYKTKGTEKSFRNLLHCFGLGDNAIKFNMYANNAEYKLEDNLKYVSKARNYINFNEIENSDASVYQYQIDSNATSFISGSESSNKTSGSLAFTVESNIVLPNRVTINEYSTVKHGYAGKVANMYPLITESSLFGMHTANGTENDLTWATNDYANFQVFAVKDDQYSSDAYFKLTGSTGGFFPLLTSSYFENVYDDQLWTFSVTVEPGKYPLATQIPSTESPDYIVKFYGVSHIGDYKAHEFLLSGTISNDAGNKIIANHKRLYVGAHRTNFTGSLLTHSDVKVESCRAWMASIPTGTIDKHNVKLDNYGPENSTRNAYLYQEDINSVNVPEAETLALRWNFTAVTGSDANGEFSVEDESSGSADDTRYGWFSDLVSRRHTASGSNFASSSPSVVDTASRSTYQTQVPEVLNDSNLTRILSQDDEFF